MKTLVVGAQYGDEGKARVVGYFAKNCDWTIRFSGGGNAGHTVYDDNGVEHKLHYLAAGCVFGKKVAIDTGAVVNLEDLSNEINKQEKVNLFISKNVHTITKTHIMKDSKGSGIGSTKKGIAYVYGDRALRKGHRITQEDLDEYGIKATLYRGLPPIAEKESAVFESAQGLMLDIDYGDYPYVTSSSVIPSMAHKINKTVAVMKAYCTRVGSGPPYTPDIENLRITGNEFGTTTGRPRNCHWNDIDQLKYAFSILRPDEIVVTKLDILNEMNSISVYENGNLKSIGNVDNYKNFLLETFPKIKYFSESPKGDLIQI